MYDFTLTFPACIVGCRDFSFLNNPSDGDGDGQLLQNIVYPVRTELKTEFYVEINF